MSTTNEEAGFRPLGTRVLVRKIDGAETSAGGIILTRQSEPTEGIVLAVGPEVTAMQVGDRVLFGPRAGTEIELYGRKVTMFREEDIYGVFE